jgi:hypothetical protein
MADPLGLPRVRWRNQKTYAKVSFLTVLEKCLWAGCPTSMRAEFAKTQACRQHKNGKILHLTQNYCGKEAVSL